MANQTPETPKPQLSEAVFSWQCPEDVKHKKNKWWYLISIPVLILLVWWLIRVGNPLFAIFLTLFYLVILMYEYREPRIVETAITPDGVKFGNNFYYYKEFDHFYIIYEETGIKNLYLELRNPFRGRLIISVAGQNAVALREYLLNFLKEDLEREVEPLSERIRRWLRL